MLSPSRARLLPLLFLLTCLAGGVGAQPAAGPSGAASITAGVKETVLPNGLKVLTKEVHSAPVVAFQVWYRVGSRNEHEGITGTSHLLEHMMFKGTQRFQVGEISRSLFVNGADFNAGTYYDWTFYHETLASDRLEFAMQLEADRMSNTRVSKSDLQSEMTVVRSELEGRENSPDDLLQQAVQATAIQAHPYHWPVIGWRSDVENVPRDAVYHYYKTHYGPNNATVVIVGDFNAEAALGMVRKYFGPIPRIPPPPKVYTAEPPQRGERRVTLRRAGALPIVLIGYKAAPPSNADSYAMDVLAMVLSSGRASRLYEDLIQKQIATNADAANPSFKDPYLFFLSATARPGATADQLEKALLEEAERSKTDPPSEEELARVKRQIEAQFVFGNNSVSNQAEQLGNWESILTWKYLSTYLEKIRAVTAADVQRVAQKYLIADGRTVGQFIPTSQAAPAGPPPGESSARVEKAGRNARPIPLPKPAKTASSRRNISRFKLENGLTVVVAENHASPTVAITGSIPAGRAAEPETKRGVAGLTASMLSRGTEKRSALEFAKELEGVGASLSASSQNHVVQIGGRSLTRDFDHVSDLLAEMLRQPAFPEQEFIRLKGQALAGLDEAADDPNATAGRAFNRLVYPEGHPLRQFPLDEARKSIDALTPQDLADFYHQQYGPDNAILVIVGDVKAAHVKELVQRQYGDWSKNPGARPVAVSDLPLPPKGSSEVVSMADKSEADIVWGFPGGVKRSDPDYYAVEVMNTILGGGTGLNSRLADVVRDQQGLAYSIFSFYQDGPFAGPFSVGLGTNPANARKALASVAATVKRFKEQGVTQREVDEAVAYLTGSLPVGLETNEGVAGFLWEAEFYHLGADYLDRYAGYYRAVTVAAANSAAKKHLHPESASSVIAGTVPER